jgi:sugar-specific transcriptional regulator TrmB
MFEQYLQEIGLSEKEARIYLALLQVDRNTVQELANRTKINRTTVYPVLESLQKKGLVSEIQEGKKVEFMAEPPERLETFAERQRVVFEEHASRLKDIIPQIKSMEREKGERPVVKYFEGREGSIAAHEEFYAMHEKKSREGYFIYNKDLLNQTFTAKEQDRYRDIRIDKLVKPVSVYTSKSGDLEFKTDGNRIRIDDEKYPITSDIIIIEDRIIIGTLGDHVSSILIKSKDFATTLASLVRYINDTGK